MLRVSQYQELHQEDSNGGLFLKMIHYVSIVNDLDPLEIEEWEDVKLLKAFKKVRNVLDFKANHTKSIIIEDVKLSLIDFSKLKLGQFIDLETHINNDHIINLHKIIALLYLEHKQGGMYEDTIEPIANVNVDYRGQIIQEMPIDNLIGAVKSYLQFRQNFFQSYKHIFVDPLDKIDEKDMTEEELKELEKAKEEEELNKANQWFNLLNIITQNDLTKFDQILDTNLFLVFNQLGFVTKK